MKGFFLHAMGLDKKEESELMSLVYKWNRRRKKEKREQIEFLMQLNNKRRCSRGIGKLLHRKRISI